MYGSTYGESRRLPTYLTPRDCASEISALLSLRWLWFVSLAQFSKPQPQKDCLFSQTQDLTLQLHLKEVPLDYRPEALNQSRVCRRHLSPPRPRNTVHGQLPIRARRLPRFFRTRDSRGTGLSGSGSTDQSSCAPDLADCWWSHLQPSCPVPSAHCPILPYT